MSKAKKQAQAPDPGSAPTHDSADRQIQKHLRIGWWSMLLFMVMGLVLEALHGFKVDWYLNVANETRRLMFTLAHSHGVLIGALHLGYAFTIKTQGRALSGWTSMCLTAAGFLLPGGFLLGGAVIYAGDPGKGIVLVPVGALLLIVGAAGTALGIRK